MRTFTAICAVDEEWHIASCLEVSGAFGQGRTKQEALESLTEAIELLLECRLESADEEWPGEVERETVVLG